MSTYTPIYMKSLWFGNQKYYLNFHQKKKINGDMQYGLQFKLPGHREYFS